ncbi:MULTISPECIES: hypothetical protein [Lysobacter]|jgi:hypothetical protein|uniref:hypothetical protein n=1 Tax=Lysobacter TaxID=68 RepID=UPI001CBBE969|nr:MULTISPECIES: hypothetical protein [Lysobacter]UJB19264.1 hypothetical protein L1A79_23615 [Lysobacter capsici]UJQ27011.1 hypothetical protein L2D09_16270 [Lysobacter gummosus]
MRDETQVLKDYLAGLNTGNRSALAQLTVLQDWSDIAQREIERRATFFLQKLPDDVIQAIASGDIDVRSVIGDVLIS